MVTRYGRVLVDFFSIIIRVCIIIIRIIINEICLDHLVSVIVGAGPGYIVGGGKRPKIVVTEHGIQGNVLYSCHCVGGSSMIVVAVAVVVIIVGMVRGGGGGRKQTMTAIRATTVVATAIVATATITELWTIGEQLTQ